MFELDATKKVAWIIALYERGAICEAEVSWQILDSLTPSNVADVFQSLPDQFKRWLKSEATKAPITDEDWETAMFYVIGRAVAPELPVKSPEERQEEMDEWKRNYRQRITTLRDFLRTLT